MKFRNVAMQKSILTFNWIYVMIIKQNSIWQSDFLW